MAYPEANLEGFEPDRSIPESTLWLYDCVPISVDDYNITLAIAEPHDGVIRDFQRMFDKKITLQVADVQMIRKLLLKHYDNGPIIGGATLQ